MTRTIRFFSALSVFAALATPAAAQTPVNTGTTTAPAATATETTQTPPPAKTWKDGRTIPISYFRPMDKRGTNVFETTKDEGYAFEGFKLDIGANFTTQVQNLHHSNTAIPVIVAGVNTNQLMEIGFGVNNSTANMTVNAQLAPGIRVNLTSYLSARHHNETWVKDGYLQMDKSPINWAPLNALMEIATVRLGHMEINYGDAHFRRSDNGNAMFNPFVGNYLLDAFTTEIAGEVYLKPGSVIAMGAITAGEIRGSVLSPSQRGPSYIGKLGFDRQFNKDVRVRLTGSVYHTNKSLSNTLYSGDRAGSRYYFVLENTAAVETTQKDSGLLNPGFKNQVNALQANPFVKLRGLEVFGVLEHSKGKASTELTERTWNQQAVDVVYRFHSDECGYVGARYNRAQGELAGITGKVGASRWEFAGGWFMTTNILTKVTYTNQKYFDWPTNNIKNGGKFKGMMIEAVIGF
jgi:hypothetical protein